MSVKNFWSLGAIQIVLVLKDSSVG